jgi:hypothetical protein
MTASESPIAFGWAGPPPKSFWNADRFFLSNSDWRPFQRGKTGVSSAEALQVLVYKFTFDG